MARRYFEKLPVITYNNFKCRDLSARVVLDARTRNNPTAFYPLEIEADIRPDQIAEAYFEDAEMDWLLYLTNKTVDPYYGWHLSADEFSEYIIDKYGSQETAIKHIAYFRNNWAQDDNEISVGRYNGIASISRKYYSPIYGQKANVIAYKRKEQDWTMNTNITRRYSLPKANSYIVGEIIEFRDPELGGVVEPEGSAEVIYVTDNELTVHHLQGNTYANSSWTKEITGEESGTVSNTNVIIYDNYSISNNEAVYWSPVSYYDLEVERNSELRNINIIDKSYAFDIENEILQKFRNG